MREPIPIIEKPKHKVSRFLRDFEFKETVVDAKYNQCDRYPVFKNISHNWRYDYKAEERKRFKGNCVWDASVLDPVQVDNYLRTLFL